MYDEHITEIAFFVRFSDFRPAYSDRLSELDHGKNGTCVDRRYSNDGGTNRGLVTGYAKCEAGGEKDATIIKYDLLLYCICYRQ